MCENVFSPNKIEMQSATVSWQFHTATRLTEIIRHKLSHGDTVLQPA